ncbi:MAG: CHAP domain-containing protein [bacterium]
MAANPTPEQLTILQDLLLRDSRGNHQLLSYYLKLILRNRPLVLKMPDGTPFTISPETAWTEVLKWNEKAGLPMGDKGSRQIRASRLLNYLELVQGNTREAATNFQAIKDSVNTLNKATPVTNRGQTIKKMVNIRKLQLEIHNRQAIGQLATNLEQTSFIKRFAGDRPTQIALAGLFAANAANFINADVPKHVMADEITKLVQLNAGRTSSINNAAHLAYSQVAQDEELAEITTTINNFATNSKYNSPDEFIKETGRISHYSHILTVGDIPDLVDMLAPTATPEVRQSLSLALQTTIIRSTGDYYTDGSTILSYAFNLAGLPESEVKNISSLAPFLEEIRGTELHNTIGGNVDENDPRILNTKNISAEIGVSAHIPWLNKEDLDSQASLLQKQYGSEDLAKTLQQEINLGEDADFKKISSIKKLFSNIEQHNHYTRALDDNPVYNIRNQIGKTRGRFAAISSPIDRFSQKVGKKIWAVDDFVHSPFKYIADKIEDIQEKVPILNPGKFIYDKFVGAQLWIAQRVLEWSDNLIGRGHWARGILTHISDFSRGFITEGGSWSGANYTFVQKKWGDLLDWGAKKTGRGSWQALKGEIGTKLWSGFSKMAPELAKKLSAGELSKVVASLVAGELSAGTTLLIQAGLMLIGSAFKKIKQFFTDSHFRDQVIRRIPALIAAASVGLAAVPGAIVAGLIAFGSGALSLLGSALGALFTSIFLPAMIAVGSMLLAFFLLFQVFNITKEIDSNDSLYQQVIAGIVCDEGGGGPGSAAVCIADYLQGCNLSPLTASLLNSSGWKCLLAQTALNQNAKDAIQASTSGNNYFQCVGMAAAYAGQAYNISFPQINAKDYANNAPSGFRWIGGGDSCQPGALFVDTGGTYGHIGVVIECAGANIVCVDSNYGGPGVTRNKDQCRYPTGSIAGYLIKS